MSGPKYSRAVIETQRLQKMIEELERTIENNKRTQLQNQIKNELSKIENEAKRFKITFDSKIIEYGDKYIPEDKDLSLLKNYIFDITSLPSIAITEKSSSELADILAIITTFNKSQKGKISAVGNLVLKLKSKIDEIATEKNVETFMNTEFDKDNLPETMLSYETYSLYLQLIELISVTGNYDEIKEQIDFIITNHSLDESYKQKQLKLRIEAQKVAAEVNSEILSLKAEASVLLAKLSKEAVEIPDSLDELISLVEQLRSEAKQNMEDEYISNAVTDVLEEIGYSIEKSETVRTPKRVSQKRVCDFSDDSILQAATSNSGAVMFEIMSRKDTKDIAPIDKTAVKGDMEHFCPDYQIIKDHLAKRGIILTNEQLSEPSEKYVRGSGFGGKHNTSSSSRRGKKEVKYNVFN